MMTSDEKRDSEVEKYFRSLTSVRRKNLLRIYTDHIDIETGDKLVVIKDRKTLKTRRVSQANMFPQMLSPWRRGRDILIKIMIELKEDVNL